jgi:hypothetical protein
MTLNNLTTKQFGDACEHLVLAELALAGWSGMKMPDNNRGYDLQLEADRDIKRISVKARRSGINRSCAHWNFAPDANWDWLALVRVNADNGERYIYLVPRAWACSAASASYPAGNEGERRIQCNTIGLEVFRNNFCLNEHVDIVAAQCASRVAHAASGGRRYMQAA